MKKVNPSVLNDINVLSWILDQSLFLLANSPAKLRLSELSHATGIHASVLTRMRLVHINPQYEPCVSLPKIAGLIRFVQERFPTLVIREARDGSIQVRLFRSHAGSKLAPLTASSTPLIYLHKTKHPKPGSTRWFLAQMETEPAYYSRMKSPPKFF